MNDLLEFLTRMLDHVVGNIQDTRMYSLLINVTLFMVSWIV